MSAEEKKTMEAMKAVCIYTAGDRMEAEMLLDSLQRNGIQGYREAPGSGGVMDVYTGNSIYGEEIYVDEQDADRAKEVIEFIRAESEIEVRPGDEIQDQNSKSPKWLQISVFAILILFIVMFAASLIL